MNAEKYYLNFKKFSSFTRAGPTMVETLSGGTLLAMSLNLKELGCPIVLGEALKWIASHRSLRLIHRTEIRQRDGIHVSLAFEKVPIVVNGIPHRLPGNHMGRGGPQTQTTIPRRDQ